MSRRPSREVPRARTVAGPLLVLPLVASCGDADVSREDAGRAKAHVLAVSRDLLGGLASVGTFAKPPRAAWSGCDDLGGKVAYRVSGRLDGGAGSAPDVLDGVRDRLRDAGVQLRDVSARGDEPTTLQGDSGDVQVQVTGYPDRPVVVLSLVGPCLDVGDADDALLAEPPERLSFG